MTTYLALLRGINVAGHNQVSMADLRDLLGELGFGAVQFVMSAIALTGGSVIVFWRSGLLALAVWLVLALVLRDTPWTFDLTRWYAWPTWFTTALIAGLAFWGFRNVLGRQSAFPRES